MNTRQQFIVDDFSISLESTSSSWTMPYSHRHTAHEIYILESGERTVTIDDIEYTADTKTATLFLSNSTHKSRGIGPFAGICIHFSQRYIDLYFNEAAKEHLMKCFNHKVIILNDENFDAIKNIADHYNPASQNNFLKLAVILDILNQSAASGDNETPAIIETKRKKSQKIIEYVDENYVSISRISDITELFDVSENYVFQVFRQTFGTTPKQYINKLRINTVCHRIKHTDKTIKSIAFDCGFDSYEYFICVFKKIVGCTPSIYKERVRR